MFVMAHGGVIWMSWVAVDDAPKGLRRRDSRVGAVRQQGSGSGSTDGAETVTLYLDVIIT